jgi:hypothetical protein
VRETEKEKEVRGEEMDVGNTGTGARRGDHSEGGWNGGEQECGGRKGREGLLLKIK